MKTVFLDTVGLLALWDGSDQWHEIATARTQRFGLTGGNTHGKFCPVGMRERGGKAYISSPRR